jgi:PST family polysaccharide transporter
VRGYYKIINRSPNLGVSASGGTDETSLAALDDLALGETSGYGAVVSNATALVLGQAVGLIAPLVTIPYIARVLGPGAWAPVLIAQGLGNWLVMVLEFAFDLSGTREIARARTTPAGIASVVHGVQSAKILLVALAAPIAALIAVAMPSLRASPALIASTLVFAVCRGLSPLWYFQGVERVRGAVAVESGGRLAAALAVFWVVATPADAWRVVGVQALIAALSLAWVTARRAREGRLRGPDFRIGFAALREHIVLFACRAWSGLYIQANVIIVGAIAPAAVAFFGGAERIIRAAVNMLQPVSQAVMPRISFLQHNDPRAADRMIRACFLVMGAIGASMAIVAYVAAPLLVRLILGPAYEASVPILRILAALPFLISLNAVLGIFWAVPNGRERAMLGGIVLAGVTNVVLAVILVPRLGPAGMALSAIAAEIASLAVLVRLYVKG